MHHGRQASAEAIKKRIAGFGHGGCSFKTEGEQVNRLLLRKCTQAAAAIASNRTPEGHSALSAGCNYCFSNRCTWRWVPTPAPCSRQTERPPSPVDTCYILRFR